MWQSFRAIGQGISEKPFDSRYYDHAAKCDCTVVTGGMLMVAVDFIIGTKMRMTT